MFRYLNAAGADPLSMLFFALGASLICRELIEQKKNERWIMRFAAAGLLMGIGALCRYHILVAGGFFIVAFWIVYPGWRKRLAVTAAGLLVGYSPQIVLSVLTGHGILSTGYGLVNIYNLMYHCSWYQTITLQLPSSVMALIARDPLRFMVHYAKGIAELWMILVPPLLSIVVERNRNLRRFCIALFLGIVAYSLFAAISTSARAPLVMLPFSGFCAALFVRSLYDSAVRIPIRRMRRISIALIMAFIAFSGAVFAAHDVLEIKRWKRAAHTIQSIENFLMHRGVVRVSELFSTEFNLYFPSFPPYLPYFNGGCPRWGTYGFNEEYPELNVASLDEFIADCRRQGIRFVILNTQGRELLNRFGDLFDGKAFPSAGIQFVKGFSELRVFEVIPAR
jgi:hypothetical protein